MRPEEILELYLKHYREDCDCKAGLITCRYHAAMLALSVIIAERDMALNRCETYRLERESARDDNDRLRAELARHYRRDE